MKQIILTVIVVLAVGLCGCATAGKALSDKLGSVLLPNSYAGTVQAIDREHVTLEKIQSARDLGAQALTQLVAANVVKQKDADKILKAADSEIANVNGYIGVLERHRDGFPPDQRTP